MQNIELTLLGKIIKVHGFHGDVVIALEGKISEEIKEMESVFVEIDGKPVPFFFEWIKDSGQGSLLVKFDYYDSDSGIAEFVGCKVYTDRENLLTKSDEELPLYLSAYTLYSSDNREIGKITKVVSFPMQVMLEVQIEGTDDILIPYSEELVINTDRDNRIIIMELPEGIDTLND